MLESEKQAKASERERVLAERVPGLQLSGLSLQELQVKYFKTSYLQRTSFFAYKLPKKLNNYKAYMYIPCRSVSRVVLEHCTMSDSCVF